MSNETIAVIAGETITNADFDAYVENLPQEQKAYLANPQAKQHFIDQMIAMRLFEQLGKEEKLNTILSCLYLFSVTDFYEIQRS